MNGLLNVLEVARERTEAGKPLSRILAIVDRRLRPEHAGGRYAAIPR